MRMPIHTYVYTYKYIQMYVCTCIYVFTNVCTYTHMQIFTYKRVHLHTYSYQARAFHFKEALCGACAFLLNVLCVYDVVCITKALTVADVYVVVGRAWLI